MPDAYRDGEIRRLIDAGPNTPDETWYRLHLSGREHTRHLNVSAAEVDRIARTLGEGIDDAWFSVNIRCEGSAFDAFDTRDDPTQTEHDNARGTEIARILRDIADRVESNVWGPVRDINGNTCGTYEYTSDDGWEPRG